ncbi:alpha/beta fold hydrolase [Leisingera sp. ANG59]|uniref:alpha/beta hydrolase family protein n=1 Tax=Leisingera sp. ANG59 TaxID=2675221 RepID=UPI001573681D|nr:alpha/beta fold hydrolase [Leisingera sp. ANG59]NSY40388.1 alpha/beta fold hydrolase [Leisingera sp. ANG59]
MLRTFTAAAVCLICVTVSAHAEATGFRQVGIDSEGARPLHVALWYPTEDRAASEQVGENPAFIGIDAIPGATPKPGPHPLIVLSHGFGGNWRNLNWLAGELVREGYAVAAPDHPGTTTFDRDPVRAAMLWERPRDLSRTIDAVLADPVLAGEIDPDRIAAIGHSLGGWTVTAVAGGRFDPAQFTWDCEVNPSLRACSLSRELGLADPALTRDFRDPRVRSFVSLDLGLARGFTPESLAVLPVPALILGAGIDVGDMSAELESGWLSEHLPAGSTRKATIPDAMHFSFMQQCKPGGETLIEAQAPGEGIICHDGGDRGRAEIHAEISAAVISFLEETLLPR